MAAKPKLYSYEVDDLSDDLLVLRALAGCLDVMGAVKSADQLRLVEGRIRSVLPRLQYERDMDKATEQVIAAVDKLSASVTAKGAPQ